MNPSAIPTQQPTQPQPNWWQKALPTIGGIGGGILGGLAGALVPGANLTGASEFGGGVAGASAGGAAGKWLENKLTGQKDQTSGVLDSAIQNGAGQAFGGVVGKVAGVALGATGNVAGNAASSFLQGQAAKGALGHADAGELVNMGINDLRNLPDIAKYITGASGALNTGVNHALEAGGSPVDVSGIIGSKLGGNMTNDLLDSETAVGNAAGKKILTTVNKGVQNMLGGAAGSLDGAANPVDVLAQSRVFRNLASAASTASAKTGNAEQLGVSKIYNGLADELETRLFRPGGVDVPLLDTVKSTIIDNLAPLKVSSPQVYDKVVGQVGDAQTAQELRPLQALWVRASQGAEKTAAIADKGGATTSGDIVKGTSPAALLLAGHPALAIGAAATSSPAADRVAAKVLPQLSDLLGKAGASSVIPALTRAGSIAAANLPNDVGTPQAPGAGMPGATGTTIPSNMGGTMQPQSPLEQTIQDQRAMQQSLMQDYAANPNNAAPLSGISSINSNLTALTPQAQTQALAMAPIQQAITAYQNAGGAQGGLAGGESIATSLIPGTAANAYQGDKVAAANALAQLLHITPQAALQMLPGLMQNSATAGGQTQALQSILGTASPGNGSAIPLSVGQ